MKKMMTWKKLQNIFQQDLMMVGLKENVIVGRLIPAGTGGATQQIRRVASDRDNIVIEAREEEERQAVALAAPTEEVPEE